MRDPRPWSKRRFLAVYWAIQGVVSYLGWAVLVSGDVGEWFRCLRTRDYASTVLPIIVFVMAAQAVLVTPVRRPEAGRGGREGRWLRSGLGGLAAGAMASYVAVIASFTLDALELRWLDEWSRLPWTLIVPCAVVAPPVSVLLAWRYRDGLPVLLSLTIAACLAASLAGGLVMAVGAFVTTGLGPKQTLLASSGDDAYRYWFVGAAGAFVVGWTVATPLLWVFVRGKDRESALSRLASRLLLGTIFEAAAIVPLDVMVRRKTACYCAEGTLWALTICWGVGTLVLGPAVWLIPMSRRRRRWAQGRCEVCDYDMSGCMGALCCPECGAGWRSPAPSNP